MPGTKIISDHYASYVSVNEIHTLENNPLLIDMNYTHEWVNHSRNFVDPITGAHTQRIEGVWEIRIKQHLKIMRGCHKDLLPTYLDMFLWGNWFGND